MVLTPRQWLVGALGAGLAGFQMALAVGAPWGAASWGGAHSGVLPASLRWASAASAVHWAALTGLALSTRPPAAGWRRTVLRAAAVLCGVGTAMNLASPSMVERLIWTPTAAALALGFWRLTTSSRRPATV